MKKHTTKVTVPQIYSETSAGIQAKQDNVEIEICVWIHDKEESGGFEFYDTETGGNDWYASGGLWFEGKELTDYDGVFSLSPHVIKLLEKNGFDCSYAK